MSRKERNLQASKKIDIPIKSGGTPSLSDVRDMEVRFITGYGLRLVVKHNNKLYYFNGSTTLST